MSYLRVAKFPAPRLCPVSAQVMLVNLLAQCFLYVRREHFPEWRGLLLTLALLEHSERVRSFASW